MNSVFGNLMLYRETIEMILVEGISHMKVLLVLPISGLFYRDRVLKLRAQGLNFPLL